jgi:hypothetical protein
MLGGCSLLSSDSPKVETFWLEIPGRGTIHISENLIPASPGIIREIEKGYKQAELQLGQVIYLTVEGMTILALHVPDVYGDYSFPSDTIRVSGGPGCPFGCIPVIKHELQHRICFKLKLPVDCYQVDHTITLTGELM